MKEDLVNDGRLIDIRHKEDAIKFIILPPKQTTSKSTKIKDDDKKEDNAADS